MVAKNTKILHFFNISYHTNDTAAQPGANRPMDRFFKSTVLLNMCLPTPLTSAIDWQAVARSLPREAAASAHFNIVDKSAGYTRPAPSKN